MPGGPRASRVSGRAAMEDGAPELVTGARPSPTSHDFCSPSIHPCPHSYPSFLSSANRPIWPGPWGCRSTGQHTNLSFLGKHVNLHSLPRPHSCPHLWAPLMRTPALPSPRRCRSSPARLLHLGLLPQTQLKANSSRHVTLFPGMRVSAPLCSQDTPDPPDTLRHPRHPGTPWDTLDTPGHVPQQTHDPPPSVDLLRAALLPPHPQPCTARPASSSPLRAARHPHSLTAPTPLGERPTRSRGMSAFTGLS